jgi:hypothetical protein
MTSPIQSVQVAHSQLQTEQTVQPPKTLQSVVTKQNTGAQDTVTISQEARQAHASNTKQASGRDANHDGG